MEINKEKNCEKYSYNYLYGILIFIMWNFLGSKLLLFCLSGYLAYRHNQNIMWYKFVFFGISILFGWLPAILNLFMLGIYGFIFYRDQIINKVNNLNQLIELIEKCYENQDKYSAKNKFEQYDEYVKKLIEYWKIGKEYYEWGKYKLHHNIIIDKYQIYITKILELEKKYKISYYLNIVNKYIELLFMSLYKLLKKYLIGDKIDLIIKKIEFKNVDELLFPELSSNIKDLKNRDEKSLICNQEIKDIASIPLYSKELENLGKVMNELMKINISFDEMYDSKEKKIK